ncbi:Mitogen-activated kinase [Reticulomyxa filosa]|uniref:mitogen-activated protein kinase kinase n=1 Tax=Reticulomyxa filosa TaxID=46433 RepID=X6P9I6_RETFI|nr:Mitogen-activated kinase [Reticulomyxa filosa]|eukprot:ETO35205.1 Mitogen-activated kinase [Reticulomyxa filosa]
MVSDHLKLNNVLTEDDNEESGTSLDTEGSHGELHGIDNREMDIIELNDDDNGNETGHDNDNDDDDDDDDNNNDNDNDNDNDNNNREESPMEAMDHGLEHKETGPNAAATSGKWEFTRSDTKSTYDDEFDEKELDEFTRQLSVHSLKLHNTESMRRMEMEEAGEIIQEDVAITTHSRTHSQSQSQSKSKSQSFANVLNGLNFDQDDHTDNEHDHDHDHDHDRDVIRPNNLGLSLERPSISSMDDQDVSPRLDDESLHNIYPIFPIEEFAIMPDERLGRGASGVVVKAFHLISCKVVAIKATRSTLKSIQEQTNQEINVLTTMKNSNYIIDMIRFGRDPENNAVKIALEYMDGGSLRDYICSHADTPCSETVVQYVSHNILHALKELHQHSFVHNDIKPGNILYSLSGDVKLSDFGTVLKIESPQSKLTVNCGTTKYLAPEKDHDCQVRYDTKADIWSFGLTIYELSTSSLIHDDTPPSSLCSNPPQLNPLSFSKECCDFNPDERPTAEELLQHPFLRNVNDHSKIPMGTVAPKITDLKFMVYALIEYYAKQIPIPINSNVRNSLDKKRKSKELSLSAPYSPKDKDEDMQKLVNMANYCNCAWEAVQDRIVYVATKISNKMSKHY